MGDFNRPEPLASLHDLDDFDCGSVAQTEWLRRSARMAHAAGTGRVYVTTRRKSQKVIGFYALAAGAIAQADAPSRIRKGAGAYPISVVILTRLGVDITAQGEGLGRSLVRDALFRVEQVAESVGVRALLIHAETQAAKDFYLRLAEFDVSTSDPLHLLLLMKDLRGGLRE